MSRIVISIVITGSQFGVLKKKYSSKIKAEYSKNVRKCYAFKDQGFIRNPGLGEGCGEGMVGQGVQLILLKSKKICSNSSSFTAERSETHSL